MKSSQSSSSSKFRGSFLSQKWTLGYLFKTYPLTRLAIKTFCGETPDSLLDLTLIEFREHLVSVRKFDAFRAEITVTSVNNVVGSLYDAEPIDEPSDWLHTGGPAPEGFWTETPVPVELTPDKIGIVRKTGLGIDHYAACSTGFGVFYSAATGELRTLAAYSEHSGSVGSQLLFPEKFIKFGVGEEKHSFQETILWAFGFENFWGNGKKNRSTLALDEKTFFLVTEAKGTAWVELDWKSRKQGENMYWRVKGYDKESDSLILYTAHATNRASGNDLTYPPYSDAYTKEEIALYDREKKSIEHGVDRLQAGNLFLLISGNNGEAPHLGEDGAWRWENGDGLRFQISSGDSIEEAMVELKRARNGSPVVRMRGHYEKVSKRSTHVSVEGHPNIEAISAHAPLGLEALKLPGDYMIRYGTNAGFMDPHTSFLSMRAVLYGGDHVHAANFLEFLSNPKRRGPEGQIAEMLAFDGLPDHFFLKWSFQDVSWLGLAGHLYWHSRDEAYLKFYKIGREHIERIIADTDSETGLFRTYGKWPDLQVLEAARKGRPWVAWESGLWYEALRNWELLATRQGEADFAERLRTVANKVKAVYQKLFYNPEVGFIYDAVDPVTRGQHPYYTNFHLNFLGGYFAHELFDDDAMAGMAETLYRDFYDTTWKTFSITMRHGNFHSDMEWKDVSWGFAGYAKIFRIARHEEGLRAIRESYEFHYGKMLHYLESFNMFPSMVGEEHRREIGFNCGISSRYQAIIEGFGGIHLSPDNMGIYPLGMKDAGNVNVDNLQVGKSKWNLSYNSSGDWPVEISLDGMKYAGSWVFPSRTLKEGAHRVEVKFGDAKPGHPILLEAIGVEVVDADVKGDSTLTASLRGPGRAYVKLWSPSKPTIHLGAKAQDFQWDARTHTALLEVSLASGDEKELTAKA